MSPPRRTSTASARLPPSPRPIGVGLAVALIAARMSSWTKCADAFVVPTSSATRPPAARAWTTTTTTTALRMTASPATLPIFGLFGRFRKSKSVAQNKRIGVGDKVPDMDVEIVLVDEDGTVHADPISLPEVLGPNRAVLVGMPAAFSTTCTSEHLPGYIRNADKLANVGVEKVVVITTNDQFVNKEWMDQAGSLKADSPVKIVSDGDGDVIRDMGLSEDMGFGLGERSKRFSLVTDGGQVAALYTDPGMNECSSTSAENMIRMLTPEGERPDIAGEIDGGTAFAAVAAVAVVGLASQLFGGGGGGSPSPAPVSRSAPPSTTKVVPAKKAPKSESSFSMINEYLKE